MKNINKFQNIQNKLLVLFLSSIAVMVFLQVLLRYVFHLQLFGIEELVLIPAMWLYFLGGANASFERSQLRAPIIDEFFKNSNKIRKTFEIVKGIFSLFLSFWFTYWAYHYTYYLIISQRKSPTLYIPLIYFDISIIICFLLMNVYIVIEIFDSIKGLKS